MLRNVVSPLLLFALGQPAGSAAGELRSAKVTLDVWTPGAPGWVPEAAPIRFALLDGGRIFAGGTSRVAAGRLEGDDRKQIEKLVERVAEDRGLPGEVTLAPGPERYRLYFGERDRFILASGDPRRASIAHRKLADLIQRLERFEHRSLTPFRTEQVLLSVRRGELPGGCRSWSFEIPLESALRRPVAVPTGAASGWPLGATPASVCHEGGRYVVTARPLLPGES